MSFYALQILAFSNILFIFLQITLWRHAPILAVAQLAEFALTYPILTLQNSLSWSQLLQQWLDEEVLSSVDWLCIDASDIYKK